MIIGSFGNASGWAGRQVAYDEGVFSVDGEEFSLEDLLAADQQGLIVWAYDGLQEWARQLPAVPAQPAAPATPAVSAEPASAPVVRASGQTAPEASAPSSVLTTSPRKKSPQEKRRRRKTNKIILLVFGICLVSLVVLGVIGSLVHKNPPAAPTVAATVLATPTDTPSTPSASTSSTPTPKDKLPMRVVRERVRAILTANVGHYAKLLAAGERALGSTQYTDANAGLAAFNDPNSAASKFRDYQGGQGGGPTNDMSYLSAFSRADSYYTAADEPTSALNAWQNDISNAQGAFSGFTEVGTSWQIKEGTTAQLRAAERQITDDLAKARRDIAKIVAGK